MQCTDCRIETVLHMVRELHEVITALLEYLPQISNDLSCHELKLLTAYYRRVEVLDHVRHGCMLYVSVLSCVSVLHCVSALLRKS